MKGRAVGHGALTVSTTAVALPTIPANASAARITGEAQAMRYRYDGGAPTATAGHELAASGVVELEGRSQITAFLAIRAGGTDGTVRVTYFAQNQRDGRFSR